MQQNYGWSMSTGRGIILVVEDRCGPGCSSSTTTAAVVYFPAGTYLISSSIIDYWETQLIGNPIDVPTIVGTPNFTGNGLIDGGLNDAVAPQVEFYRQIRNFVLDTTNIPAIVSAIGLHWPTSQASSLQNIVFKLSDSVGTAHIGLYIENGSAGFVTDIVFHGGLFGAIFGNQQFTMRNLTFSNAVTAIEQTFDWSWVYKSISISNCSTGITLTVGVGSVTVIDSSINDTGAAISSPLNPVVDAPFAAGSLILENVQIDNVGTTIQGSNSTTVLEGTTGSQYIPAWGQGDGYNSSGSKFQAGFITPNFRPASLLTGSNFYERSKPQYSSVPASQFLSVRDGGAKGYVELSELILSTQGAQAGATLLEYNLATSGIPSGLWDIHTRIGGFIGPELQIADCLATPDSTVVNGIVSGLS